MKDLDSRLRSAADKRTASDELAALAIDPDLIVRKLARRNPRTPAASKGRTGRIRQRDRHLDKVRSLLAQKKSAKAIRKAVGLSIATTYRLIQQVEAEVTTKNGSTTP
jgi:hypothetical protein